VKPFYFVRTRTRAARTPGAARKYANARIAKPASYFGLNPRSHTDEWVSAFIHSDEWVSAFTPWVGRFDGQLAYGDSRHRGIPDTQGFAASPGIKTPAFH
jgi:hypothetical protein